MAKRKQGDQLLPTYSSSVRIRDVALKSNQKQWTIGRSSERGSGISVLVAWQDDDDDDFSIAFTYSKRETLTFFWIFFFCVFGNVLYSRDTTIRICIHSETKSTIMTNEHTSLEKYTFHTLCERVVKGLCVRGELENEKTATYWPPVPLTIAALFSHSAGLLNRGSWGPKPPCWQLVLTASNCNTTSNKLIQTVCGTGLYNCFRPPASRGRRIFTEFNPSTCQGYILISSTGCTCFSIDG